MVECLVTNALSNINQLQELNVGDNEIGPDGLQIFASALVNNCSLKTLLLSVDDGAANDHIVDIEQISCHFKGLLCDTSSVNNIYLSNHTLECLGDDLGPDVVVVPDDVQCYLDLNSSSEDKGGIAMSKILRHHSHFNMQPFFEWELKALPLMISWFDKASTSTSEFEEKIAKMKLSATFDFIKEFPMLYIEPISRQEIAEYSAMEMLVRGSKMKHSSILKEILQCKARALRRF